MFCAVSNDNDSRSGDCMLPHDKMPEAEVTLRLAIALIEGRYSSEDVVVAIDGAQVKTGSTTHFELQEFMVSLGWVTVDKDSWRGSYRHAAHPYAIVVHSSSGEGDLVAKLQSGKTLVVESKKGSLQRSKSSSEYPLIREAIGQLMTIKNVGPDDILAVAVPNSDKFESLATQWRDRPLMVRAGIHIATVGRDNRISGLQKIGIGN